MAKKTQGKKRRELTYVCYVIVDGVGPVPLEDLTAEQRATWEANMTKRLSANMSAYYTQHPDEYVRLCAALDAKEGKN